MARGIVRISFNSDYGSADTQRVRKALESNGMVKLGTAVYEGYGDESTLLEGLRQTLDILDDLSEGRELDHLWVYLDNAHPPTAS